MPKSKGIYFELIIFILFSLFIYTRFVGLDWGLPYSMHPDERNMTNSLQQLKCEIPRYNQQETNKSQITNFNFSIKECLNPHFFAYGQFPLYLAYFGILGFKLLTKTLAIPISFAEAAMALRIISAITSILNALILLKITELLISKFQFLISNQIQNSKIQITKQSTINNQQLIIAFLIFIFSPFFIQFAHFGTTESLLMFLYSVIIYVSLKYSLKQIASLNFFLLAGIFSGMAIASKISSVIFLVIPLALILNREDKPKVTRFLEVIYVIAIALIFSIILSPHNFITFKDFLGAMKYESDVALGTYRAFYTRQFEGVVPIFFQAAKIFPYSLGLPVFVFSLLGFVFLPYKKEFNILRLAILAGFIPNAFMYAKWTRFVAPILPMMLLLAILFLSVSYNWLILKVKNKKEKLNIKIENFLIFICNFSFFAFTFSFILAGIAYLTIYQTPDVRFTASEWIYQNIPDGSYILSETGNVVDLPIPNPKIKNQKTINITYISFDFYNLDESPELQEKYKEHLGKAQYIFIPSRRVFTNHYCNKSEILNPKSETNPKLEIQNSKERCEYLRKKYPILNEHYDKLYSGELGFEKVAEFTSFPRLELFGKKIIEFSDEDAEETWTVFDHPVFRIYKRV